MKSTILLYITCTFFCTAQAQIPDSLFQKLRLAKEDSNKARLLNSMARYYINSKSDSALYYLEAAKKLSEQLNFAPGLINYYINASATYNAIQQYETGLILNKKSILIAENAGNKLKLAYCLANTGVSFQHLNQPESCAAYYLKAIPYLDQSNDHENMMYMYGNLCALYHGMEQYRKGLGYAFQGLDLHKKGRGSDEAYLFILTNIAGAYQDLNKFDSTVLYAGMAIEVCKKEKNYQNWLINLQNLFTGTMYIGNYSALQPIIAQLETLGKELQTPGYEERLNFDYCLWHYYNGRYKLAEAYGKKCLRLATNNEDIEYIIKSYQVLSKVEIGLGNYQLSDQYDFKKDSLHQLQTNDKIVSNVQDLEKKYETQKKDNEILTLNAANRQKSTLNKILIGSTAALFVIGLLIYRNFRGRQKLQQAKITELEKDKQLLAIDAMLKGQEEERSRIAKDLHDGLGGMLSGTKLSFMNMKEVLILSPENAALFDKSLNMLDNTIGDLRKVAHNLMPEALVKYGLYDAIRDFCDTAAAASSVKVDYQQMGTQRKLSNTAEVFIYRIIQELVNNALKHANAKQLIVQLTTGPSKINITVEDDGKGYDTKTAAAKKGAGLDNIQYRVQYFNGTIDTITSPGNGTSVNIELFV